MMSCRKFQLTRPMRGVTRARRTSCRHTTFQLTRPMRGVTKIVDNILSDCAISTHTPHAGRDGVRVVHDRLNVLISTHTPHAGRDQSAEAKYASR